MGAPSRWLPNAVSGIAIAIIAAYIYAAGFAWSIVVVAILPLGLASFHLVSGIARLNIRFVHGRWNIRDHLEVKLIESATSRFAFMTITGRTSLHRADVEEAIKVRGSTRRCEFRFLLLHPMSRHLEPFCRAEGSSPDQTRDKIFATTQGLLRLRMEHRLDIEVRWYDVYPVWRLAIVDDAVVHAGYYEEGRKGYEGPRLVCPRSRHGGLYVPFARVFEETWAQSSDARTELGRL